MFFKVCNDIIDNYLQVNKINYKKGKFKLSEITHDVNGIIHMFFNSYYFENSQNFKFVKSKTENGEDYFYIINDGLKHSKETLKMTLNTTDKEKVVNYFSNKNNNPFRNISLNRSIESSIFFLKRKEVLEIFGEIPLTAYKNTIDAFNFEFDVNRDEVNKKFNISEPYQEDPANCIIHEITLNEKMIKTIEKLKESELFSNIFTESDIVKNINLKKKREIEFNIVDVNYMNSNIQSLTKFSDESFYKYDLKHFYGLNYFASNRDEEFKAVVAHNDYEIAGIAAIIPPYDNNIRKDSCFYLSYVEVSEPFYGMKIGIKLVENVLKYAKENNLVVFRTSPSELGKSYIQDKITRLGIEKEIPLVSEPERNLINKLLIKVNDKSNEEIFKITYKTLKYARDNYPEKDLAFNKTIDEIIDIQTNKNRNKIKLN